MRPLRCGVFSSSGWTGYWDKAPSVRPGRPKVKDGGGFPDAQHETRDTKDRGVIKVKGTGQGKCKCKARVEGVKL